MAQAKKAQQRRKAASKKKTKKSGTAGRKPSKRKASAARTSSARQAKDPDQVRLNKYLADHGIASRRGCDTLIQAGKVFVDGESVTELGTKINPQTQEIEIDGRILRPEDASRQYYLLNKPIGVVCTNARFEKRPRAVDLITDRDKGRIYTVGRLDEDSHGLIILTNDGEFAQQIAHPRYGVTKTYRVKVQGRIEDEAVQKVRDGIHLAEGKTGGARILIQRRTVNSSTLLVTIREGKNRELRRVFARVGHKVLDLARVNIGPLTARGLKVGRWRTLSRAEVEGLLNGEEVPLSARRGARKTKARRTKRAVSGQRGSGGSKKKTTRRKATRRR